MYCQKCGYKVKNGSASCGNCGAEVFAEFCGGFWDILETPAAATGTGAQDSAAALAAAELKAKRREEELKAQAAQHEQELLKSFRIRIGVVAAICGLLLIGLVVQTIRMQSASAKIKEAGDLQVQSAEMLENQKHEQESLQKKLDELEEENKDLEAEVKKLTEEKEELEDQLKPEEETEQETEKETEQKTEKETVEETEVKDPLKTSEENPVIVNPILPNTVKLKESAGKTLYRSIPKNSIGGQQ